MELRILLLSLALAWADFDSSIKRSNEDLEEAAEGVIAETTTETDFWNEDHFSSFETNFGDFGDEDGTTTEKNEKKKGTAEPRKEEAVETTWSSSSGEQGSDGGETKHSQALQMSPVDRLYKLSDQVRIVLETYRSHGVVTLPGAPIPDPMPIADFKKTIGGSPINFKDMLVYGLSNFTVDQINTDLDKMMVFVLVRIKEVLVLGNYSMRSWFSKANGPFNVTLRDVETSGSIELKRNSEGDLEASDSELDMTFADSRAHFDNMGTLGTVLQGLMATGGPVFFDAIKPAILDKINNEIRGRVNDRLKSLGRKIDLKESSPLDRAVEEGRRYVRENGYDPFRLTDRVLSQQPFLVNVSEFELKGLSNFRRVGEAVLTMEAGTVEAGLQLATGQLEGSCRWEVRLGEGFSRSSSATFTVKSMKVKANVTQSLDVSRPPQLESLDLQLGHIRVVADRSESFNFLFAYVINRMPAIIRDILVDAMEVPIKMKVQEILNEVNVEEIVENALPALDEYGV